MKRKLFLLLLTSVAAACLTLGVAGCGPEENETTHEHTFSEEWTFDEEYHWHEATCGHDEVNGRAAHTFDGNACTVCGYEKQPEPCDEHVDEDGDGLCDVCGETMPEEPEPEPTEGLEYFSLVGGTYYTVTGIGTATDTNIVIPSEYKGKPVKKIDSFAFMYCYSIENVIIPESIIEIGGGAFSYCTSLKSIVIPESVTCIGDALFGNCSSLESITVDDGNTVYHSAGNSIIETATKTLIAGCKNSVVPGDGSVTSIGSYAFDGCSPLTVITIPDGVTSIDALAFNDCGSLKSVSLGNDVTSIGDNAFYGCYSLTAIAIPNSITSIDYDAFDNCTSLEFNEYENALYLGND